ncbi:DNA-binding NarL/FixJ family response regulator [Microbacterium halimionae]|uniref:DNA-binding NarL/FixJ family response regulator n=1 Tax=Microbacterium halimionae TaxID=1526413 RepID=A0A7W3JQ48_9MICO|nr:response regulator transcription factor [Microbacterium halimionae]MBA8816934.1 DNA-binding NarL/FixJ family response regulator [Microbacterium halimionae]NII94527.1 DNA-binding NarL/FixJ family response regulator [Microbacterium halimionae]
MSKTVRVLLADDHAMMRAGFRVILEAAGFEVVGEASTGAAAVRLANDLHPDVVCMDVQMPDMDGLVATERIVSDPAVSAAVLVVTTFDRDDYLFAALEAGASGFLLKNAGPEELVNAVRVVAAGDALLAPEVTRRVIARFAGAPTSPPAPITPNSPPLTEREREVLALLADAQSNAEIAARLFIGEQTVKTHVSNLLQKLGARDRAHAIVLAYRHGLV